MSFKFERRVLQDRAELDRLIDIAKAENCKSYLEIGCKYGGSLWYIANALPKGSRIVGVDLPHGDHSLKEALPYLKTCFAELCKRGYQAELIIGDSTDPNVVAKVQTFAPFDLCLIDANHTEPYVRADWANYGPLARVVAFHDIGWVPRRLKPGKMPIEVPPVWNEIKQQFRHREIKISSVPGENGIGVLWRG